MKNVFIFLAGLGIGVGGTYVLLKKRYDILLDEEIEATKAFFEERQNELINDIFEEDENFDTSEEEKAPNEPISGLKKPENKPYNRDEIIAKMNDYTAYYKGGQKDDDEEYEEEVEKVMNQTNTVGNTPYIISDEDYYSDNNSFDKVTITFYESTKEGIGNFETEDGKIIPYDEMMENIGNPDFLKSFGEFEPETLFVRNPSKETDYEIIREEGDNE